MLNALYCLAYDMLYTLVKNLLPVLPVAESSWKKQVEKQLPES